MHTDDTSGEAAGSAEPEQGIPDVEALDALVAIVFDDLRSMARRQLAREHNRFTFQTTELVHEVYLRLSDNAAVSRQGRAYFYAAAARAMRQVLVDASR